MYSRDIDVIVLDGTRYRRKCFSLSSVLPRAMSGRRSRALSAKLIPDWERSRNPEPIATSHRPERTAPKCVRRQRNFSSARFNARRPRRRRPFRGINVDDPVQRAQCTHSRISIIVRRCNGGGRILKKTGVSGAQKIRRFRNFVETRREIFSRIFDYFIPPRYDNLMLPRSVNVRYASEP